MKALIVDTPRPACILRATDPARAHIPAADTDVRRTFQQHAPVPVAHYGDDYDLVHRQDWLSAPGGFR